MCVTDVGGTAGVPESFSCAGGLAQSAGVLPDVPTTPDAPSQDD